MGTDPLPSVAQSHCRDLAIFVPQTCEGSTGNARLLLYIYIFFLQNYECSSADYEAYYSEQTHICATAPFQGQRTRSCIWMSTSLPLTCCPSSAVQSVRVNESTYRNEQRSNDSLLRMECTQGFTNSSARRKRPDALYID
jgi:hypothetical protein